MKENLTPIGVIAADGHGSRMLPATKTTSKDMITVGRHPIMHYVIQDFVKAGIKDLLIVTSRHDVAEHFIEDADDGLVEYLEDKGKLKELEELKSLTSLANITTFPQDKRLPYGNARPLVTAYRRGFLGNRPVAFAFSDDWIEPKHDGPSRFEQLLGVQQELGGSAITLVHRGEPADYKANAFAQGTLLDDRTLAIQSLIEKPGNAAAVGHSTHASVGGYLLDQAVLPYIEEQLNNLQDGHEFAIQSGFEAAMHAGEKFYGLHVEGDFIDAGTPLGLALANLRITLDDPAVGEDLRRQALALLKK